MNSVIATTRSSIYLAIKHIFPEVPINAGTFEPLHIEDPEGTFLYARYPRPVSGCAAEVSQRIAEAVFSALVRAIPDQLFAAPAGTSGNFCLGGYDPKRERSYVMYVISGGVTEETPRRTDSQMVARQSVSQRPPRLKSWNSIIPFSAKSTHFMKDQEVQEAEEADSG